MSPVSTPHGGSRGTSERQPGKSECAICYSDAAWWLDAYLGPNEPETWPMCVDCKKLVDVGRWDLLGLRKVRSWELRHDEVAGAEAVVDARRFCLALRKHMTSVHQIELSH